jgi:hypothetical protein
MTLTLELAPDVESALAEDARRKGMTPEELALDNLRRSYAVPAHENPIAAPSATQRPVSAMVALFAQWEVEDATDDPEEIARRNREWEQTKANLEANRFSLEGRTDFRALLGEDAEDTPSGEAA